MSQMLLLLSLLFFQLVYVFGFLQKSVQATESFNRLISVTSERKSIMSPTNDVPTRTTMSRSDASYNHTENIKRQEEKKYKKDIDSNTIGWDFNTKADVGDINKSKSERPFIEVLYKVTDKTVTDVKQQKPISNKNNFSNNENLGIQHPELNGLRLRHEKSRPRTTTTTSITTSIPWNISEHLGKHPSKATTQKVNQLEDFSKDFFIDYEDKNTKMVLTPSLELSDNNDEIPKLPDHHRSLHASSTGRKKQNDDDKKKTLLRKLRRFEDVLFPLLIAYKLKFFALIPVLISGLTLLVGSTGLAGFFFALFTVVAASRAW